MTNKFLTSAGGALALGFLGFAAAPVVAEDAYQPYNPYAEAGRKKPAKENDIAAPPGAADQPYLKPMDEVAGNPAHAPSPSGSPPAVSTGAVPATGTTAIKPPPARVPALKPQPPPRQKQDTVMRDAVPPAVEKGDLAPVMAGDGSGLPHELWRGLDLAAVEGLISELDIPPRSPALHNLWKRLVTSGGTPPSGGSSEQTFVSLRLEALLAPALPRKRRPRSRVSPPLLNR